TEVCSYTMCIVVVFFFFQAEDGIRDRNVTGVQTCALPISNMERSLTMELVRVTEAAALSSSRWMGRGKKNEADEAATTAMRAFFDTIPMRGTVVIGEGEMDEAPMLYIGE